jgi:hypothetical protein
MFIELPSCKGKGPHDCVFCVRSLNVICAVLAKILPLRWIGNYMRSIIYSILIQSLWDGRAELKKKPQSKRPSIVSLFGKNLFSKICIALRVCRYVSQTKLFQRSSRRWSVWSLSHFRQTVDMWTRLLILGSLKGHAPSVGPMFCHYLMSIDVRCFLEITAIKILR